MTRLVEFRCSDRISSGYQADKRTIYVLKEGQTDAELSHRLMIRVTVLFQSANNSFHLTYYFLSFHKAISKVRSRLTVNGRRVF